MDKDSIARLVVERELHASRTLEFQTGGWVIVFDLKTITAEEKRSLRKKFDSDFPVPPVISYETPLGKMARFNLEDPSYKECIIDWQETLSYGILAATLGVELGEVKSLEDSLPARFMTELFSTAELINGVQSEPLADLVRESMWAEEVTTWLDTFKPKGDEVKLTDKPLFRQVDAMIEAGYTFEQWDTLTPREKLIVINWYDYKRMREAYINWWTMTRNEPKQSPGNPMRIAMGG